VSPGGAAPSIIFVEGFRLSRNALSFFRSVRVFLSGLADSSAFHEVSLCREVSIIFTSNGPIVYRCEANDSASCRSAAIASRKTNGRPRFQ
jgi:hypothetical protein